MTKEIREINGKDLEVDISSGIGIFGPPIEVTVNGGVIKRIKITKEAVRTYTKPEILILLEIAGIDAKSIVIPIPYKFHNTPLDQLRFSLRPGTYNLKHQGSLLIFPESAIIYEVRN